MVELVSLLWFQEVDGACQMFVRGLPDGEIEAVYTLGGSCELASVTPGPNGPLLLRGAWDHAEVWQLGGGEPVQLDDPLQPAREIAVGEDGVPLVLVADYDGPDSPFWTKTLRRQDGAWVEVETTSEAKDSVWALEGGPIWQARDPDGSADRWVLESAPGFTLELGDEVRPPRRLKAPPAVAWGVVPLDAGELRVRYTILGGPRPVGPVYYREGRRWRSIDDHAFLETPASIQGSGDYRLLSYRGASPVVVDARDGRVVWRPDEDAWVEGALLR